MSEPIVPSVDHLAETWASIDALCSGLSDDDWAAPTGCPGWSVQDHVAHLIDYESRALGHPQPDHAPASLDHIKNPMGEYNEVGVDRRRSSSGAEVLEEFRSVMAERLAQLRALGPADLQAETATPVGTGTVADMLTLRVMDTWSHEQDIRRALLRPGHETGGAATESIDYFARFLPLVFGKRAGAPDGARLVVSVGGAHRYPIVVEGGRARPAAEFEGEPTVAVWMSAPTFAALVGGRSDAPDDVVITGDAELGRALVDQLGFMP